MTIDFTPLSEYLNILVNELDIGETELMPIANRLYAEFDERVFEEGKNKDGKVRPKYKIKDYEDAKKEMFNIIPTGYVNLRRTEDMRKNVKNLGYKKKMVSIGFDNAEMSKRFEYQEKRFGKIRGATKENEKLAKQLLTEEILRKLRRLTT